MSEKYRTVLSFPQSPDVTKDLSGQAGYEVLLRINGEDVKYPKIANVPAESPLKIEIEAALADQVAGLVFPVDSKGVFGPGRPFNFTVKQTKPPAAVGEPTIVNVFPPIAVV